VNGAAGAAVSEPGVVATGQKVNLKSHAYFTALNISVESTADRYRSRF